VRDGALIAGTVIAAAMPGAVRWATGTQPGASGERQIFFILSLIYIPLILGACAWCVTVFRERPRPEEAAELKISQWIHASLANRPFRILLIAYTISAIGNNLPATLILYYADKKTFFSPLSGACCLK
jgi:GPH family glycoside/pentoside/hexuronide:cation symporter